MFSFSQSSKFAAFILALGGAATSAYSSPGHDGGIEYAFPGGESSPTGNLVIPQLTLAANGLPILNSNANAIGSAYIDFDGGFWNDPNNIFGAYSTDSDGATFNTSEQEDIYRIWLDVATHFAMFDINVTTVAPDKTVTPTAHLLITNDFQGAGAANRGAFGNNTGQGARGAVCSGTAINRSGAVSHELGHIIGLRHQSAFDENGNRIQIYRGADEWDRGAIMGGDTVGKFIGWTNGRVPNGSDQFDVEFVSDTLITTYNDFTGDTYTGEGFREDDHGVNRGGSTSLVVAPVDVFAEGIIERYDDVDGFKFKWLGGDFHAFVEGDRNVAAIPEFASSLGMNLELTKRNGTFVDIDLSADPGDTDAELFIANLASGQYILNVSSAGDIEDLGTYNLWVNPAQLPTSTSAPLTSLAVFDGPQGAGDVLFAAVPEPSSLALLGIGGLMLIRRRRGE